MSFFEYFLGLMLLGVIVPAIYLLLKRVFRKVPLFLPPLGAALTIALMLSLSTTYAGSSSSAVLLLALLIVVVAMAEITAFLFFEHKNMGMPPIHALALVSCGALMFLVLFLIGGSVEMLPGQLVHPGFSYRFPMLGWFMDGAFDLLHAGEIVYASPVFEIVLYVGLYMEIVLVSAVLFLLLSFDLAWLTRIR
jgi:hypothetical protein